MGFFLSSFQSSVVFFSVSVSGRKGRQAATTSLGLCDRVLVKYYL